jgi:hypothetical protein
MAKKSAKNGKGLIQKKSEMTAAAVLEHPIFRDVAQRLETMHKLLQNLPVAVGEAVAEASRRPPAGASGPPVHLIEPKTVEILAKTLVIDGKTFVMRESVTKL